MTFFSSDWFLGVRARIVREIPMGTAAVPSFRSLISSEPAQINFGYETENVTPIVRYANREPGQTLPTFMCGECKRIGLFTAWCIRCGCVRVMEFKVLTGDQSEAIQGTPAEAVWNKGKQSQDVSREVIDTTRTMREHL